MLSWKILFYLLDECFSKFGFNILAIRREGIIYKAEITNKDSHIYYNDIAGEFKSWYNNYTNSFFH